MEVIKHLLEKQVEEASKRSTPKHGTSGHGTPKPRTPSQNSRSIGLPRVSIPSNRASAELPNRSETHARKFETQTPGRFRPKNNSNEASSATLRRNVLQRAAFNFEEAAILHLTPNPSERNSLQKPLFPLRNSKESKTEENLPQVDQTSVHNADESQFEQDQPPPKPQVKIITKRAYLEPIKPLPMPISSIKKNPSFTSKPETTHLYGTILGALDKIKNDWRKPHRRSTTTLAQFSRTNNSDARVSKHDEHEQRQGKPRSHSELDQKGSQSQSMTQLKTNPETFITSTMESKHHLGDTTIPSMTRRSVTMPVGEQDDQPIISMIDQESSVRLSATKAVTFIQSKLNESDSRDTVRIREVQNDDEPVEIKKVINRIGRDFSVKRTRKVHLFEGIPYIQYGSLIRKDAAMQTIIVRDLLKVLGDKCSSLKTKFLDYYRVFRAIRCVRDAQKESLNQKLEETIGLLSEISTILLQEFSADPKKIGVRENPISKEKTKSKTFESQESRFQDNMELFNETLEYFRDCFDCYAVMCRQKSRAALDDEKCILAMQLIHRGRFNVGDILEEIRMYDKNYEDEKKWAEGNHSSSSCLPQIRANEQEQHIATEPDRHLLTEKDFNSHSSVKNRANVLKDLLRKKFNFTGKNITRESKVQLNTASEEKKLALLKEQMDPSKVKPIADNRKLIQLQSLTDPLKDTEIRNALVQAKRMLTNIPLSDEFVEMINNYEPEESPQAEKMRKTMKLSKYLRGLLQDPKIRVKTLAISDPESEYIINKLDEDTNNAPEILKALVKNKPHAVCVIPRETLHSFSVRDSRKRLRETPRRIRPFNQSMS